MTKRKASGTSRLAEGRANPGAPHIPHCARVAYARRHTCAEAQAAYPPGPSATPLGERGRSCRSTQEAHAVRTPGSACQKLSVTCHLRYHQPQCIPPAHFESTVPTMTLRQLPLKCSHVPSHLGRRIPPSKPQVTPLEQMLRLTLFAKGALNGERTNRHMWPRQASAQPDWRLLYTSVTKSTEGALCRNARFLSLPTTPTTASRCSERLPCTGVGKPGYASS
jgi:hypothetical protein